MLQSNLTDHAQKFPPIIGIDLLSQLLNRKKSVISLDRCLRPHTLPPACVIPGTRKPLWVTDDVVIWLRQYQEKPKTLIGAPTKANRVKSRQMKEQKLNDDLSS